MQSGPLRADIYDATFLSPLSPSHQTTKTERSILCTESHTLYTDEQCRMQTRERRSYHTKFEISQQTRFFTYFLTLFCAIFIFTGYYN